MVMSTEENQGELKFGLHEVFFPPFLHTIIAFNTKKKDFEEMETWVSDV